MTFMLGILALLWVFQIGLLQPLYEYNKVSVVKDVASNIEKVVDSENLGDYLTSVSEQNDLCVLVMTNDQTVRTNVSGCMINRLPYDQLVEYVSLAQANGGSYLMKSALVEMSFNPNAPNESFVSRDKGDKNVVYTKVVSNNDSVSSVIMVNTRVTRVNAATQTLSDQLFVIGCIIFFATVALVLFLTKKIVQPIVKIKKSTERLADGIYDNVSKRHEYLEVHELNATLEQAAIQIQKADKAKRDLIANVSHDLRTPLTMITGYGEMMLDLPNEKTDENIKVIIEESKRLNLIVNDLLDLSRLNENKVILNKEVFNITECIQNVIKTYDTYLKQENIELIFDYNETVNIFADKNRMTQVLHNFIDNAINYSNESKLIQLRQIVNGEQVRIEVQDFGLGIAEDQIPLVWERYYKVDKEHNRIVQGSGIGLAIVKEVLELHEFEYGVKSKLNEGSIFYFVAPIKESE
ncbi:MAG: HAMP domain-containing sensor histidine kinase [Anaerorhabdus sp.]